MARCICQDWTQEERALAVSTVMGRRAYVKAFETALESGVSRMQAHQEALYAKDAAESDGWLMVTSEKDGEEVMGVAE